MATIALPLRELTVNVQSEAVAAQQAYWSLAEDVAHGSSFRLVLWLKTRTLNHSMGRLAEKQKSLIDRLKSVNTQQFTVDVFTKLANDLDNVVSLTNSFVDEAYDMPQECLGVWSVRLQEISALNAHLDSFAEAFRLASDDGCTALLADMAAKISADVAVAGG